MDLWHRLSSPAVTVCAVIALAGIIGIAALATGAGSGLENGSVGLRFALRGSVPARDVVVVGIDDATFNELGLQWPFPRRLDAEAIDRLRADGATTIVYDVQFTEPTDARDDNALYRHPELVPLRDEAEEDPKELEAAKFDLNYVALDGVIGCMVNGAGLAMATMDIIKLYGSSPANFLDVGGGATREKVTAAFKIILSDPNVEGILVNIFGGIMRCDIIAEGVVSAAREVSLNVPLVVRLEGTNVALGKEILANSGLPIISADNLADAAEKIVHAVKEAA